MYVEDYLDILLGFKESHEFDVDKSDHGLLLSIANQSRRIGLTDRQLSLLQSKLEKYIPQFENHGYQDFNFNKTKLPLRELDRSRWIKITDYPGNAVYESYKSGQWIAVRFIFNKKLLNALEDLRLDGIESTYDKQSKTHYYEYNEITLFKIVESFKDKNFEIEDSIQTTYENLLHMKQNADKYIPGIYNYKLQNLNQKAIDYMISAIGQPSLHNLALYKDRQRQYGLHHFDDHDLDQSAFNLTSLSKKIINRTKNNILITPETYTLDSVCESLLELHRFPLLVLLNEDTALDNIIECQKRFKNFIPNEQISVMFRKDNNDEGKIFNEYLKNTGINNPLDLDTKVVYITNNKLPKPLLQSEWKPGSVLSFECARTGAKTVTYLQEFDLVMYYDSEPSYMLRHTIEKI